MESLIASVRVIFPICVYLISGFFIKRILNIADKTLDEINKIIFKVFLPIMVFKNVYDSNLEKAFDLRLLLFSSACIIIMFLSLLKIIPLLEKENKNISVIIQGIFRSNYVLFGIPITVSLYGENAAFMPGILAAFIIPLFNVLVVFTFEIFRGNKVNLKKILKGVLTNPLIQASILGILLLKLNLNLPKDVTKVVDTLGNMASPLSLIVLGGTFKFNNLEKHKSQLRIALIGKLIFVPLIFMTASILFGFREVALVVLMTIFVSPTAVSSFTMAQQLDGNAELAGQIVVLSSLLSVLVVFGWTYFLSYFGFILA